MPTINLFYLVLASTVLGVGAWVSMKQKHRAGRTWFGVLTLALTFWIIIDNLSNTGSFQSFWSFSGYAAGMFILVFLVLFLRNRISRQASTGTPLIAFTTLALAAYHLTEQRSGEAYGQISTAIYLGLPLVLFLLVLIAATRSTSQPAARDKYQLTIGVASLVAAGFGLITNFYLPYLNIDGYTGPGLMWILISFFAVAIALMVGHKTRNVVSLRRSSLHALILGLVLTFILSLVLLTGQMLITRYLQDIAVTAATLGLVGTCAFSIPPLKRILNKLTKHWFFREEQMDQEALRQLNQELLRSTDLASVLDVTLEAITHRLGIATGICYVLARTEEGATRIKQVVPYGSLPAELPSIEEHDPALSFLSTIRSPLSFHRLSAEVEREARLLRHMEDLPSVEERRNLVSTHASKAAALKFMERLQAETIVPLVAKDNLFGLIFLASKSSGHPVTFDDHRFIEVIASETITSIQRANFFEGDLQKTEFISIASHELRTPLTAIRGYLSMILDEKITGTELDGESWNQLEKASHFTRQLIAMVNDLLTLSRLESGKTELYPQQIDLVSIAKELIKKHQPTATEKKVRLKIDNKRAVPHAWADPEGIKLVIDGLIANAITYNRPGGKVRLRFRAHPSEGLISLEVMDTGIGMRPEQMEHLFEKFYRVASKETEGITGTGLGLNIIREYLHRMKGSIEAHSRYHRGSTFTLTVPLFTPDRFKEQAAAAVTEEETEGRESVPVGLILLSSKLSGEPYTPQDMALLETIGHQAITTIQRAKLYEGDQMKTQFVSVASHELLTPIGAIEGYIDLIMAQKKETMAPKTLEFLTNVQTAIHRLSMLVKDLLSVSRLESGHITINPVPFNISRSIQETVTQLEFVAKDKDVSLKVAPPDDTLPDVLADPERTTQILMNLVSNAIKYNRSGGTVSIQIAASRSEPFLKVSVADDGIGMTKEQMAHLFEKFYRVDSSETTGIVGTGLGLYITKSIVERMGGTITAKSAKNQGTTFAFTLPLAQRATIAESSAS